MATIADVQVRCDARWWVGPFIRVVMRCAWALPSSALSWLADFVAHYGYRYSVELGH